MPGPITADKLVRAMCLSSSVTIVMPHGNSNQEIFDQ